MSLVLASASPRRREMLERTGLAIDIVPADLDETPLPGEAPDAYVLRIARAKAAAVAGDFVIAADTTVTIDGLILAKAESEAEAIEMLSRLTGRTHQVLTAYAVRAGARGLDGPCPAGAGSVAEGRRGVIDGVIATDVEMIAFDPADYAACGEWRGKAGAYAIQGVGAALVRAVRGSVSNVIGLPLVEVLEALRALGGPVVRLAAGRPV